MEEFKIETIYILTGTTEPPKGQHAGMKATGVRITHLPTGMMAQCGHFGLRHKNKSVAMAMLDCALFELEDHIDCIIAKATGGE